MAKDDELDQILQDPRLSDDDWLSLATVLDVKDRLPAGRTDRRRFINQELRHAYGHTIANVFREWWEPDYLEIVRATARKLGIKVRDHHTVEELEGKILVEVLDRARERIIKEKGPEAWAQIERDVQSEVERLLASANLPPGVVEELTRLRAIGVAGALLAGRLAGFARYIAASRTFFAIARWLGLRIGVPGLIITRLLSTLLGPVGWLLTGILLVYDLGNTNWRKVIPAVVLVATLRGRLRYEAQ